MKMRFGSIWRISLAILPVLFGLACTSSSKKPVEEPLLYETEVRDFISNYDKAWAQRDTLTMKELIDERYVYFTSTGATTDRPSILGWFNPADKYKVDTAVRNELVITLNGNTAIISSRWVGSGSFAGERFDDDQRCGLVVQKTGGKLRLIAEHCVQIAKQEN